MNIRLGQPASWTATKIVPLIEAMRLLVFGVDNHTDASDAIRHVDDTSESLQQQLLAKSSTTGTLVDRQTADQGDGQWVPWQLRVQDGRRLGRLK